MDWHKTTSWKQKYAFISFLAILRPADVQYAMPMFPQPPVFAIPPPMQMVMMSVNMPSPTKKTTTTTTTTSQPESNDNMAFAFPVPMPMPMQIAVPALPQPSFCAGKPRPPACPPCPPCLCAPACTPSFFAYCSPCHQKCRCTNGKQPPVPLPPVPPMPAPGPAFALPMPMQPPPAIMVPIPPFPHYPKSDTTNSCSRETRDSSDRSSSSSESSDDSSSSCESGGCRQSGKRRKAGRRKHHRKLRKLRKLSKRRLRNSRRSMSDPRNNLHPVLSFVNNRGNVKLKHALSEDDVHILTKDSHEIRSKQPTVVQNVRLMAGQDINKISQIVLVSDYGEKLDENRKSNGALKFQKYGNQVLKSGRKELVFKPPRDKRISNLSVSFQVA